MNGKDRDHPDFCLGKESQRASNYSELLRHTGHKIQVLSFPRGTKILKVAMECVTCNRVLIEYDNPDYESDGEEYDILKGSGEKDG